MAVYNVIYFFVFLIIGAFNLIAAICNWNWYFKSSQVGKMVHVLGRTGARILYGILGLLLILFAVSTQVGWL